MWWIQPACRAGLEWKLMSRVNRRKRMRDNFLIAVYAYTFYDIIFFSDVTEILMCHIYKLTLVFNRKIKYIQNLKI